MTPLTTLSLTTTVHRDRFDQSPARDADSVQIAPGVKFDPAAFVGGSLAIGYKRFDPANPALQSFSGLVAEGSLGCTIVDRAHLDLTVKRDVQYSFEVSEPYYLSTATRLADAACRRSLRRASHRRGREAELSRVRAELRADRSLLAGWCGFHLSHPRERARRNQRGARAPHQRPAGPGIPADPRVRVALYGF